MNRLVRKYMILPICLLFVAAVALGSYGSVLCVGESGQVKVESVYQPGCDESKELCTLDPIEHNHDHHADCKNCTDLPLNQNSISNRPLTRISNDRAIFQFCAFQQHQAVDKQSTLLATRLAKGALGPSSTALSLSATVLRC